MAGAPAYRAWGLASSKHAWRLTNLVAVLLPLLSCAAIIGGYFAAAAEASTQVKQSSLRPPRWPASLTALVAATGSDRRMGPGDIEGATHQCGAQSIVGFDCTGLTQYAAYQGTGGAVDLTHHNAEQAKYAPGEWITSEAAHNPPCIAALERLLGV